MKNTKMNATRSTAALMSTFFMENPPLVLPLVMIDEISLLEPASIKTMVPCVNEIMTLFSHPFLYIMTGELMRGYCILLNYGCNYFWPSPARLISAEEIWI